jgi:uncharacterized protein (TIGR01777 family)
MRFLVTGSTGLVGSVLVPFLEKAGHTAMRLVRGTAQPRADSISWDPAQGLIDTSKLSGFDCVVHLAGENIASRRWSAEQKAAIRESRVKGTALLAESLAGIADRPKVVVCASAIGFYGERGDAEMTEESAPGTGFLPEVCKDWEAATRPAADAGIRVVQLRIGVVLTPAGGPLAKMLTPFRLGIAGKVGSGRQYMSWIALDDLIEVISFVATGSNLQGPVNATAPNPVTNYEFTKALGRELHRPTVFPMPAFAARLIFGEMADGLLLASTRVIPARLQESGFHFRFPDIGSALHHLLAV